MRPAWRDILIGWLAEVADSQTSVYISGPEAAFIRRLMGNYYPLRDRGVEQRLSARMKRPGFMHYVAVNLRELDRSADGGPHMLVNRDVALALVAAACDPDTYQKAIEINAEEADRESQR